ncbi:FAD-dependent oxidoreductase [Microbulbifer thermotolerans]|uniref:FAD-dependent oxidoreductase n=1 Tax=Microbulbifer thermotolerans TaxID=252514 RepID=A0AB35HWY4_MICTH|nr:FAD-dependent oxidoreductase [Microbulbifer thermotolerans]MCX2802107.1 FAD-dependent oxidoreductase [Microbulbifer thermotolerans]MCX2842467.1 FAD-dependent oxidoreductase [Microbulbifer thermotolerans]
MSMNFDVLVVGAGIQGAGAAEALTKAGYRVAILEQVGVAAATSSRSSKLIHGGLRYLESGQFQLVYECLRERRWLLDHKPQLVRMVPFYIPVYRHSKRSAWVLRLGLTLYSLLTGATGAYSRFRTVPQSEWDGLAGLDREGLVAVFSYYDAQTDDAALTRNVVDSAVALGARLICPGSLIGAELSGNGLRVDYFSEGQLNTLRTRALVNCSGPWVESTNALCSPEARLPAIELVAGTHIELPLSLGEQIFYVEAEDGRAVFVMPWRGGTLVGTTERNYSGDPRDVAPTIEEERYLLSTVQRYFPQTRALQTQDICNSFTGLRVLPKMEKNPFSRPRETLICSDNEKRPRVVAVAGGKLTSYRATARKVVKKLRLTLEEDDTGDGGKAAHTSPTGLSEKERNL